MAPLEPKLYGQFFGGDSYVILYTYLVNGKENYIIYFWQGQVSGCGLTLSGCGHSQMWGFSGRCTIQAVFWMNTCGCSHRDEHLLG